MSRTSYYVVFRKGETYPWKVLRENGARASSKHRKKSAAEKKAKTLAKKRKPSEVLVKTQNGKITRRHTYGDDPRRTPG